MKTRDKQGTIASAGPAATLWFNVLAKIQCDFMLVILPSFILKQLAVGRPLYIGDKRYHNNY